MFQRNTICALALAALGLSACGHQGPAKTEVISKGDAICAEADATDRGLPRSAGSDLTQFDNPSPTKLRAAAGYEAKLGRIYANEAERLRALPVPTDARAAFEQTLVAVGAQRDATFAQVLAAQKGDVRAWKRAGTQQTDAYTRETRSAKQLGLSRPSWNFAAAVL